MPYIGLWLQSGLSVNLYKKPSKAQLAQQGVYKLLTPPDYETFMPQPAQKAIRKFRDSGTLHTLHWPLALEWPLRQSL